VEVICGEALDRCGDRLGNDPEGIVQRASFGQLHGGIAARHGELAPEGIKARLDDSALLHAKKNLQRITAVSAEMSISLGLGEAAEPRRIHGVSCHTGGNGPVAGEVPVHVRTLGVGVNRLSFFHGEDPSWAPPAQSAAGGR